MSTYKPDKWCLIGDGKDFWVFGSWAGGFTDVDRWRRSSGLKRVEELEDGELNLHNRSGSIYKAHKNNEGVMTKYCQGVLNNMIEQTNEYCKEKEEDRTFKVWTLEEYMKIPKEE